MPPRASLLPAALFSLALVSSAHAVMRGSASRDPDGLRRSVAVVESASGMLCSGVVVAQDVVLTAAHCMAGRGAYRVLVLDRAFRPHATAVVRIALHPTFRPGLRPDTQPGIDLALLKLARPLDGDAAPLDPARAAAPAYGDALTLAGFGQSDARPGSARVLRQARLILSNPYQGSNRVLVAMDPERRLDGAGACIGDSGGPVLAGGPGSRVLVGIVTWANGPPGARLRCGGPTALTPLAEHALWLRAETARLGGPAALSAAR